MKTIDEMAKDIRSNFAKHIVDIYYDNADHDKIDNEIKQELESYRDSLMKELERYFSPSFSGQHIFNFDELKQKLQELWDGK